jgi:ankyrin repeat protein
MSIFKKKDKPKDKDGSNGELKTSKSKKHKAKDIWQACEMGYLESLDKMLKKKNGMAMLNMPNEEGHAPIHIAAGAGHIAIVEALLAAGAHCNMIEGAEPRWNVLHWAVSSRNFAMMKLILSQPSIKRAYTLSCSIPVELAFITY